MCVACVCVLCVWCMCVVGHMGVWGGGGVCYTHTYTHTHSTVYIFDPSSPTPLAVHGSVCSEHVIGAVFVPLGSAMEDRVCPNG